MSNPAQGAFIAMIREERQRQIKKWGDDPESLEIMCLVLGEKVRDRDQRDCRIGQL